MSKVRKLISKRKLKISNELIRALESLQLSEEILEKIIDILLSAQKAKSKELIAKEIILNIQTRMSPEEMLGNTYARLDGLIERTEEMKARVDSINLELQKLAFFG